MSVAKYSPTISNRFSGYFYANGGGLGNGKFPTSMGDDDGFDDYGYSVFDERDRAGNTEHDYEEDYARNKFLEPVLYNGVDEDWRGHNILAIRERLNSTEPADAALHTLYKRLTKAIQLRCEMSTLRYDLTAGMLRGPNDTTTSDSDYSSEKEEGFIVQLDSMVEEVEKNISSITDEIGKIVNPV